MESSDGPVATQRMLVGKPMHEPMYIVRVPPHHLSRLVGRGVFFLRDPDAVGVPLASVDIVQDGIRLSPTAFESHTQTGPLSRVARTATAGACMACYDRTGRRVAVILVEEVD